jgi:hypothetical protein
VVNKIISYETSPDFDPWKNRITLVADDHITPSTDTETMHTYQTEQIAAALPRELEQRKIYLVSYRAENTAQGRRLPDANVAIIDQINRGTVVINYTGHGSYDVWAHERVFLSEVSIPQLVNANRLTFVTAATCTFGLYDRPGIRSGTELMILKRDGGAVGGLSAPRVVYSGENDVFNQEFFKNLLTDGREPGGRAKRLGEAIFATKQRLNGTVGYEKFHLFADPSSRLDLPRHRAEISSIAINGEASAEDTVQLRAFSKVTVNGRILDDAGTTWSDFDGLVEMSLFDADRVVPINEPNWTSSYKTQGGLLYRGQASVTDGIYSVNFIVPKDISYEGNNGRLSLYFDNDVTDGVGFSVKLRIGGSDSSAVEDNDGPLIKLFMDTRNFQAGDLVAESSLLLADLYDDNGINTTGVGIGHDIEMWLDGSERSTVLNEFYKGDVDSYKSGTVQFRVNRLEPGRHTLKLRAWDIYNNAATSETYFTVASSGELTLASLFNYPNPMTDNTMFTFQHNLTDAVNVEIKVYTLAGRLVKRLEEFNIPERFVRIPWDGRDDDGNTMANGTYFYKVICRTVDGGRGSEAIGKLSILK